MRLKTSLNIELGSMARRQNLNLPYLDRDREGQRKHWRSLLSKNHPGKQKTLTQIVAAMALAFWGAVLIGIVLWLSGHGSPGGALACLAYSIGYFSFAWIVYHGDSLTDRPPRD